MFAVAERKMTYPEIKCKKHSGSADKSAVKRCARIFCYLESAAFGSIVKCLKKHGGAVSRNYRQHTVGKHKVIELCGKASPIGKNSEREHCRDYTGAEHYTVKVDPRQNIVWVHRFLRIVYGVAAPNGSPGDVFFRIIGYQPILFGCYFLFPQTMAEPTIAEITASAAPAPI